MSKVATYLQEHILGEVTTNPAILDAMSRDGSVLHMMPEMVVYPRVTNDIRKIARFAWQLAEKGHVLPITPRGGGTDHTGAAIGKGIVMAFPAHMNRILEFDAKQKLLRLQPGASVDTINAALKLQGMAIPPLLGKNPHETVGGAVANNAGNAISWKYGDMSDWVAQLEVALANGDVLQTERISKRELNKRKGWQTFEGEIYRTLDSLIDDNKEVIERELSSDVRDNVGYAAISKVKRKDGSFDLTPLFLGSQGTLGIISEMIVKCRFMSEQTAVAVLVFTSDEQARDALDRLRQLEPAFLDYYDGELFTAAAARGKKYEFMRGMGGKLGAAVVVGFDEFSERIRSRKLKRVQKLFKDADCYIEGADGEDGAELALLREVTAFSVLPEGKGISAPSLVDGAYVPSERLEEFSNAVKTLAARHQVVLPLHVRALESLVYARPILQMHKVGDKQKVFKLLEEFNSLVEQFGGHLIGEDGEGRVKARFSYASLDPDVTALFEAIKALFDPHGILNPGVKQTAEVRQLVSHLRPDYDTAANADYVPYN